MNEIKRLKAEIEEYWTIRAPSYADETHHGNREFWTGELIGRIRKHYPDKKPEEIKVLDLATGAGFAASIFAGAGYQVTGIDLSAGMLEEAKKNIAGLDDRVELYRMDAEHPDFPDDTFDVVFSRHLTWVLPGIAEAYAEWKRILKPGGLMMNCDGSWYKRFYDKEAMASWNEARRLDPGGDKLKNSTGLGPELFKRIEDVSAELPVTYLVRPEWDVATLRLLGLEVRVDREFGDRLAALRKETPGGSDPTPVFFIEAVKR